METKKQNPFKDLPEGLKSNPPSENYLQQLKDVMSGNVNPRSWEKLYLGRAGELFVASYLLRVGLNPATLPVDTGVDLIAHRIFQTDLLLHQAEHEIYQFQVKTTARQEYNSSLEVKKFNELWHKNINLIIVFWNNFYHPISVILPPSLIRMLTSGGFEDPNAPFITKRNKVTIRIFERNNRYFIRNQNHEITRMVNRFDRIEPINTDTGMFPTYACWSDGKALVEIDQ